MAEYQPTNFEIRAQAAPWYNGIELWIRARDLHGQGKFLAISSIAWKEHEPGLVEESSTFKLNLEVAQTLMDDLWTCGLRPTEGKGSAGALAATEAHLKDMQRIAFDLLKGVHNET